MSFRLGIVADSKKHSKFCSYDKSSTQFPKVWEEEYYFFFCFNFSKPWY